MNKKNIIILSSLMLVLIVIIVLLITLNNNNNGEDSKEFKPEFLTEEQKEGFGLQPETKAQVFYDDEGNVVYKIIRDDGDIVTKPEGK